MFITFLLRRREDTVVYSVIESRVSNINSGINRRILWQMTGGSIYLFRYLKFCLVLQ